MSERRFQCGCVAVNRSLAPCPVHSLANPPPGWDPDRPHDRAHPAAVPLDPDRRPEPAYPPAAARGTRQRWDPETGALEKPIVGE